MEENASLLQEQSVTKSTNVETANFESNLNMVASHATMTGHEVSLQVSEVDELLSLLERAQRLLKEQREETVTKKTFLPHWLVRYLLLLSITWQVVCIGVLSLVDLKTNRTPSQHEAKIASNTTLTVFTAVHLVVVVLITLRVAAKVASHTATFLFLIQSYLSTVLLFSGLYTLCTRFECHSFRHIGVALEDYCRLSDEKILIYLFVRLLYFSVSNSTLCGITDIQPNKWYTELIVAAQMLLSFLYFASIITQAYHKNTSVSIWETNALLRKLKSWIKRV